MTQEEKIPRNLVEFARDEDSELARVRTTNPVTQIRGASRLRCRLNGR
jgi:hypothetical protein